MVHVPARSFQEPIADHRRLVRGVVVHHEVHVEVVGDGVLDTVEEVAELARAVAWIALADDGTVATSRAANSDVVP